MTNKFLTCGTKNQKSPCTSLNAGKRQDAWYHCCSAWQGKFWIFTDQQRKQQLVKNPPAMRETWVRSLGWKDPGEGKGYPLQYSCLENSMDCIVYGVAKSQTQWVTFTLKGNKPHIFNWVECSSFIDFYGQVYKTYQNCNILLKIKRVQQICQLRF